MLVIDFGGEKLEMSVVKCTKPKVEVLSTLTLRTFGGVYINAILADHFQVEFKKKTGNEIPKKSKARVKLLTACEKVKKDLSLATESRINVEALFMDDDFSAKITRAELESVLAARLPEVCKAIEEVLGRSKVDQKDVEVLLVGGSTRIPKFLDIIQNFFDSGKVKKSFNVDEAVAWGAAIHAYHVFDREENLVQERTSSRIRVKTDGHMKHEWLDVVPVGSAYPAAFQTHQKIPTSWEQAYFRYFDECEYKSLGYYIVKFRKRGYFSMIHEYDVRLLVEMDENGIPKKSVDATNVGKSEVQQFPVASRDIKQMTECLKGIEEHDRMKTQAVEDKNAILVQCIEYKKQIQDGKVLGDLKDFINQLETDDSTKIEELLRKFSLIQKECQPHLSHGEPLQIITIQNGTLAIDETNFKSITDKCGGSEVSVVSVVGNCQTGKSTLLSLLLGAERNMDYVLALQKGFETANQIESHTRGVWMWSEPLKTKDKFGWDTALLLIDTQGINEPKDDSYDSILITLCFLMSSVTVFNVRSMVTGSDNLMMKTAAQRALDVLKKMSETTDDAGYGNQLQKLHVVVREFCREVHEDSYISVNIATDVKRYFESTSGSLMPKCNDAKDLMPHVMQLREQITAPGVLCIKTNGSRRFTGSTFRTYVKNCISHLNARQKITSLTDTINVYFRLVAFISKLKNWVAAKKVSDIPKDRDILILQSLKGLPPTESALAERLFDGILDVVNVAVVQTEKVVTDKLTAEHNKKLDASNSKSSDLQKKLNETQTELRSAETKQREMEDAERKFTIDKSKLEADNKFLTKQKDTCSRQVEEMNKKLLELTEQLSMIRRECDHVKLLFNQRMMEDCKNVDGFEVIDQPMPGPSETPNVETAVAMDGIETQEEPAENGRQTRAMTRKTNRMKPKETSF